MNGIGLLVLIAAAGQVAAAPPSGPNRDFGWERDTQNPDRALCYIIQLSPAKVADMQGKAMENPSDMPPELVGRATRILVRIGTDVLPQTPSLEELRNMPRVNSPTDVTAQLGGGRLSDVEPSDLLNVQQRGSNPALPTFPGQSSATPSNSAPANTPAASNPAMPRSTFGDSTSQGSTNPIDQAKQLDRGAPAFPNTNGNPPNNSPGSLSPTLPNYADSASNQLGRGGAATNNNPSNPAGDWRTPSANDNSRSRDEINRTADNRFQNQSGAAGGDYPQSTYPQSSLPPNYDTRTPPSLDPSSMTGLPNRSNIGFGANPSGQNPGKFGLSTPGFDNFSGQGGVLSQGGSAGQGNAFGQNVPYNQGYGNGQYINGQNPNAQYGAGQFPGNGQRPNGPSGYDGFDRVAANTTLSPPSQGPGTHSGSTPPAQSTSKNPSGDSSPGDLANSTILNGPSSSKTGENILSVFFLFSLVVNFYLGMLIRKLLTRYRALLANMRGQASPTAFSS